MMKRIFFLILILVSFQAIGQKHIYTDYMHARRGVELKNQMITGIDTSPDFSTARHDEIATRKAIKEFVENNSGSGSVNGSISKVDDYSSLLTDLVDSDFKLVKDFKYKVDVHPDSLITKGGLFAKVDSGSTNGATIFVDNQGRIWKRMNSNQFVNSDWFTGMDDSDRITAAIALANGRNFGRKVILNPRTMINYHGVYIDSAQGVTMQGDPDLTILKASPGHTKNTTLASSYIGGSTQIVVDSIPISWRVGDIVVMVYAPGGNVGTSSRAKIMSITGTTVNLSNTFTSQHTDGSNLPTQPVGTKVIKTVYMLSGRPSANENVFDGQAANKNITIKGIQFDGSKNEGNRVTEGWTVNPAILMAGSGSEVTKCTFFNFPAEVIVGHGMNIHLNVFLESGGSPYHLSGNDTLFDLMHPTFFVNNKVRNCNIVPRAINGHNEGTVSLSWNGGYLIAEGNWVQIDSTTDAGFIGSLTNFGDDHDRELITMANNYCKGLDKIADLHVTGTNGFECIGNTFEDMGTQTFNLLSPNATITFCGNTSIGTTVLDIPPTLLCDYNSHGDAGVAIGKNAGKNTIYTSAQDNTAVGKQAMELNTSGNYNTAVGSGAFLSSINGLRNTVLGTWAGLARASGNDNTILGYWANGSGLSGDNNVFIGSQAGRTNGGSGNIFIGNRAGVGTSGSDKLVIHNTDATSALIQGNFSTRKVGVIGSFGVNTTDPTSPLTFGENYYDYPKIALYKGLGVGLGASLNDFDYYSTTNHKWFTGSTISSAGTQRMVLTSTGLGVGVTSPAAAIDATSILARGYFSITNPSDNVLMAGFGHLGNANAFRLTGNSVNPIGFSLSNNSDVTNVSVQSQGDSYFLNQVGFGVTNPAHPIDVVGSSNLDGSVTVNESGSDADFRVEGVSNSNLIQADALLNGVGINTAAVNGNTLSIKNRAANVNYVEGINSSGVVGFEIVELSNSEHAIRLNNSSGVNTVNIGTGEAAFINNDDPVSLGTTSPFGKLYVKGRSANAIVAFFESQSTQGHIGVTNTTMGSTGLDGVWVETDGNNAILHNKEAAGTLGLQAGTFTFNALEIESDGDVKVHSSVDFVCEGRFMLDVANSVFIASGTGSPEGALTAGIGSTFHRNDGGAGTSYYVKESGTGNTGWVAK